ncbi:MAG: hypothetical protein K0S64_1364 [Gaiellaceae bacterium]|jgi:hypothetical protein|nr:hypothetical protein [Gaiellaceae bacterium]
MTDVRLLVVLCALTVTTTAAAAVPTPVRATMSTSSTKAFLDEPWRYTVVVKDRAGRALAARMRLQVLSGSTVVRCWKRTRLAVCSNPRAGTWISFTGKRTGVIRWPVQSAGEKLTFQAIVVTGTRSLRLRAPVAVQFP